MNPGGDYGKKELSPALKNRFTEIWCPGMSDTNDLLHIINMNLRKDVSNQSAAGQIVEFVEHFKQISSSVVSIRDVSAWVAFINSVTQKNFTLEQSL